MIQPGIVDIELTNLCNLACGFCLRPSMRRPGGVMDINVFKRVIDELAGFDFPEWGKVVLAGFGEPTLHPCFVEAAEYAASRDLPLRIYTNGTRLEGEIRRALLHPGIKSLKLSINVHGAEMLARVTRNKASWQDLVQNVVSLLRERVAGDAGPEITVQLLYSADLPDRVKEKETPVLDTPQAALVALRFWQARALEIARETGVPSRVKTIEKGDIKSGRSFELFENVKLKLCHYLPYRTHFDPGRNFPSGLNFANCCRHFKNIVVFWDGSCTPCCTDVSCQMYLGNVTGSSVKAVFNSASAVKNREKWSAGQPPGELCRVCLYQGE